MTLFFFPFAGGSEYFYMSWFNLFIQKTNIITINLPGRGKNFGSPLIYEYGKLVDVCISQVLEYQDLGHIMFFGHSMGAKLAFDVAEKLEYEYNLSVSYLFLSGSSFHDSNEDEQLHNHSDTFLAQKVVSWGGNTQSEIESSDYIKFFLPILRADLKALTDRKKNKSVSRRINANLLFFFSTADDGLTYECALSWKEMISGKFSIKTYPGNHFFINHYKRAIIDEINSEILWLHSQDSNKKLHSFK